MRLFQLNPAPPPTGAALGSRVEVSLGYSFRIPTGWTSKESSDGVMLLPAGVIFDPNREDNPEIYLVALRSDYDQRCPDCKVQFDLSPSSYRFSSAVFAERATGYAGV